MQTNHTYRFVALFMASLMLLTSVGFTLDMHYCQDQLRSTSLFGKADSCYEMAGINPVEKCSFNQMKEEQHEGQSINKKDCCHNKTLHFQSDQNQEAKAIVDFEIASQTQQFIAAYIAVFHTPSILIQSNQPSFADYSPPIISKDYSVLFQSFLI